MAIESENLPPPDVVLHRHRVRRLPHVRRGGHQAVPQVGAR